MIQNYGSICKITKFVFLKITKTQKLLNLGKNCCMEIVVCYYICITTHLCLTIFFIISRKIDKPNFFKNCFSNFLVTF